MVMRAHDDGYPAGVAIDDTRPVLIAQGAYYAATGLLPFASRRAFEAVTGPKREWWLVQTVGLLVTVVGGALISAAARRTTSPELLAVAAGSAASLAAIDVVYVARGRIAPSYLADAAVQLGLLGALARRVGAEPFPGPDGG
jgi:hypothetical protein